MRYLLQKVLAGQPSDFYESTKENNVTQSNKIMKNYDQCTASKQRTLIHLQYKRHEEKCHYITFKQLQFDINKTNNMKFDSETWEIPQAKQSQ
jgi:hypothetical protein